MLEYLPYVFGSVRLLLGVLILIKTLGLFGSKLNPDGFLVKHQGISIAMGGFLLLSGLYTIFFSTGDTYKV